MAATAWLIVCYGAGLVLVRVTSPRICAPEEFCDGLEGIDGLLLAGAVIVGSFCIGVAMELMRGRRGARSLALGFFVFAAVVGLVNLSPEWSYITGAVLPGLISALLALPSTARWCSPSRGRVPGPIR